MGKQYKAVVVSTVPMSAEKLLRKMEVAYSKLLLDLEKANKEIIALKLKSQEVK